MEIALMCLFELFFFLPVLMSSPFWLSCMLVCCHATFLVENGCKGNDVLRISKDNGIVNENVTSKI